jgi:hypothetical protein
MTRSERIQISEDGGDHDMDEFHMWTFILVVGGEHDPRDTPRQSGNALRLLHHLAGNCKGQGKGAYGSPMFSDIYPGIHWFGCWAECQSHSFIHVFTTEGFLTKFSV